MKRVALCLLAVMLLGCGCAQTQEDPFRVDTVVLIPVDPTDAPTEEPTEEPTEAPTKEPTAVPTEEPAESKETTAPKTTSYKSTASGGKTSSSGKNQSTAVQKSKETQPPATEPALMLPPAFSPAEPPYNPSSYIIGELEHALLHELNMRRLEAGAGELTINERLSGIAYVRAQEVSILWSHTRRDGSDYTDALSDYGFECSNTAELMVYVAGNGDAAAIAAKMMRSESHRESVCSGDFSAAGIGIYRVEGVTYLVCLLAG